MEVSVVDTKDDGHNVVYRYPSTPTSHFSITYTIYVV